jgi:hypothetical protein
MPAYLKIENIGVCPPEGFTVLGVSLADTSDNQGVRGQFGSGNIAWARRVNNLDKAGPEPKEWRKLRVPIASIPASVGSCGAFTRWAQSAWPN